MFLLRLKRIYMYIIIYNNLINLIIKLFYITLYTYTFIKKKNKIMILPIYKIIKICRSLEKLCEQQILYPINIGYKIHKFKEQIESIENYTFERLTLLYPNIDIQNITEEQSIVYNTILNSEIEIDKPLFTKDEILSTDEIKLSLDDISNIMILFNENSKINS